MDVTVTQSDFIYNRALYGDRGGGSVGASGFGVQMTIEDCQFIDNDGGIGSGGAVYLFNGPSVEITDSQFIRNKAVLGGALYGEVGTPCLFGRYTFLFRMTLNTKSPIQSSEKTREKKAAPFARQETSI